MRRSIAFILIPFFGALTACPIYGSDTCSQDPNCQVDASTYTCSGYTYGTCASPYQCLGTYGNYYCATSELKYCSGSTSGYCSSGTCKYNSTTYSYSCVTTDASVDADATTCSGNSWGTCPTGQTCSYAYNQTSGAYAYSCTGGSDAAIDTSDTASCSTTCISGYKCGITTNGVSACVSTNALACISDSSCTALTGAGSLCLSGICTPPADLCTSSAQCTSGRSCVDGACVASCAATSCASGYTCNSATNPPTCVADTSKTCTTSANCTSGLTCVGGQCVATASADGSCTTGYVSVNGGCVLDNKPNGFVCSNNGVQDTCSAGSICLRHECHIQCNANEASGDAGTKSCNTPSLPVCRATSYQSSTVYVCGAQIAGTECDPSGSKTCANSWQVCINGYCE